MIDLSIGIIGMHRSIRSLWSAGEATMGNPSFRDTDREAHELCRTLWDMAHKKPDPHFGKIAKKTYVLVP